MPGNGRRDDVSVDPDLCIGSSECNRIAAAAFRLDEDSGVSVVLARRSDDRQDVLRPSRDRLPDPGHHVSSSADGDRASTRGNA